MRRFYRPSIPLYRIISRRLPANAQRQEIRTVREFDGHQGDAVAVAANRQPVSEPRTVHDSAWGAAGDARSDRPESAQQAEIGQFVAAKPGTTSAAAASVQFRQYARAAV